MKIKSPWTLIARKLADEANDCEQEQLNTLLLHEPELADSVQVLYRIWSKKEDDEISEKAKSLLILKIKQRCISLEN